MAMPLLLLLVESDFVGCLVVVFGIVQTSCEVKVDAVGWLVPETWIVHSWIASASPGSSFRHEKG